MTISKRQAETSINMKRSITNTMIKVSHFIQHYDNGGLLYLTVVVYICHSPDNCITENINVRKKYTKTVRTAHHLARKKLNFNEHSRITTTGVVTSTYHYKPNGKLCL